MRSATTRTLRGVMRRYRRDALASIVSSPLLLRRRGRSGGGRGAGGSRGGAGRARGAGGSRLDRLLVAGVAMEGAGGGELAQLVAHHVLGDEHGDELAP